MENRFSEIPARAGSRDPALERPVSGQNSTANSRGLAGPSMPTLTLNGKLWVVAGKHMVYLIEYTFCRCWFEVSIVANSSHGRVGWLALAANANLNMPSAERTHRD
jgi:hypothetical protein